MTQAMIDMLQEAGLLVGKFYSNSTTTVQHFPDRCEGQKDRTSLLGCVWQPGPDTFTFNHICSPEPKAKQPTTTEEVEYMSQDNPLEKEGMVDKALANL